MRIGIPNRRELIIKPGSIAKDLYTYTITLLPIIMVYNTPALNLSIGTVLILFFTPYALLFTIKRIRLLNHGIVSIIVILYLYFMARAHGDLRTIILYFAAGAHLCGFTAGSVDVLKLRSSIEKIAVISAVCVIIQTLSHYLLGRNVSFVLFSALQREYKEIYFEQISRFSLYRPTGPFLEPAMLSEYCIFALISCLFSVEGELRIRQAIIISIGMILTTSGIGIILTAFIWGWYFFMNRDSLNRKIRRALLGLLLAASAFAILSRFEFFNAALMRVFGSYEGYNAIEGRTWRWSQAIGPMKGKLLWLGYGTTEDFPHYLTGVPDMIYRCGLIAVILVFILLIPMALTKNNLFVRLAAIVYLILFFVAKITSVPYQVFFIGLMLAGQTTGVKQRKRGSAIA